MPFNRKFRKVEVRDVGVRVLDLNVRIQEGASLLRILYPDPWDQEESELAVSINIIVCGKHGSTKFQDWIDANDLPRTGRWYNIRFLSPGDCHDFEVVNPKARVRIRIRRSYTGFLSWDVIERQVVRRGLLWEPRLAVA